MIIKLEGYKVKYILITCVCIFLTNICLVDLKSESYDYWLSIFCAFLTITLIKDFFVLHNNNHKGLQELPKMSYIEIFIKQFFVYADSLSKSCGLKRHA